TNIVRDFRDPSALDDYVVTPNVLEAFRQICLGLRPGSGRRAWRITGDYGTGKSSFALLVARCLAPTRVDESGVSSVERLLRTVPGRTPTLIPVLLTGFRGDIARAIVSATNAAVLAAVAPSKPTEGNGKRRGARAAREGISIRNQARVA